MELAMKNAEDEAFDELARKQGSWGGGFQAKRQMAADKLQDGKCEYCVDGCAACDARAQPAQDVDYWIREATAARQAEMAMRRELEAQPAQEPVAKYSDIVSDGGLDPRNQFDVPKREWVGLTDEMVEELFQSAADADEETHIRFARAIEAKLKEKNA
jgi:hypothetical protein